MAEPLLEFVNLTVFRDQSRVLDRFSLTIPAGQNVAILGPNGSGKSTIIKLVTRELYPVVAADAAIRVLGRDRWCVLLVFPLIFSYWCIGGFFAFATSMPIVVLGLALSVRWKCA